MVFKEETQLFDFIRRHQKAHAWVDDAREYSDIQFALLDGRNFDELLIKEISFVEGTEKAKARKKYARSPKDLGERLLNLVDNVYTSTGGVKRYNLPDNEKEQLLKHLKEVRGGKSLEQWLGATWKDLYNLDPNGVIFLEYIGEGQVDKDGNDIKPKLPFPTYKSIHSIRTYTPNGQKCENILFEPKEVPDKDIKIWRVVDDVREYEVTQKGEDSFLLTGSFEHQFGSVPAVIISDLEKIGFPNKVAWIDKIIEIFEEYARDTSIKTIYKTIQGNPKHWKYVAPCASCHGTGKQGDQLCTHCDGTGENKGNDVTDEIRLRVPEGDETAIAPNVAGFISPDLATWVQYSDELQLLEDFMHLTLWGNIPSTKAQATATEIVIDTQPTIQRLNKIADTAEGVEKMLTEMIANHMFISKDKEEDISSIKYGRNYIIEALSSVIEQYQKSKQEGDNAVILDDKFRKVLLTTYKSDPIGLAHAELKSDVEPYLHYTIQIVKEIFGDLEAQRKGLFETWWKTLDKSSLDKDSEKLVEEFMAWFDAVQKAKKPEETPPKGQEEKTQ